jgi:hypothetical protein
MISTFGSNGQRVLALIAAISGLSADQVDQITSAWRQASPDGRARAWAELNRLTGQDDRYPVLAAASLARREALEAGQRLLRTDWAFWAAACDAGAAVAVGAQIGAHYDTLVAPFAQVMPSLVGRAALLPGAALSAPSQISPGFLAEGT